MMNLKRRKGILFACMLTLTIALGGCAGDKEGDTSSVETPTSEQQTANAESAAQGDSSITIGIPQDLDSLDPNTATGAGTKEVLFNIYEGLVKPDSQGNLNPAIASDYTISEDGLTYTFTLRDGITFHNGNPVTVADVKYSIDKCADTTDGSSLVAAFSNIKSVETPDEATIVITLNEANPDFLAILGDVNAAIVPADVADLQSQPVGTGPYMYVSRSPQENVVLAKYDGYWGEAAHIENVTLKVISDADAITMNLNGGSVDMIARVSTAQAAELDASQFEVLEGSMNLVQAMYLNNSAAPFDNELVRQALCYAVNPQEIMDFMSDGKGSEIGSSMFPAFGKYFMPELNDTYNTDTEKAKALLAEAGYPDGFSFTITVPSNYQQHIDTATVLVEELKAIGVTAEIQLVEWDTWLSDVYSNRNYQATVVGVDASTMTASALLGRFVSDAHNNFVNYNNPDYDAAYAKATSATDDAEKTQYYKECETILSQTAANVYIQDIVELVALNKKYAGYEFYPLYVQDFSKLYIVE